jgi:hypothetical protein
VQDLTFDVDQMEAVALGLSPSDQRRIWVEHKLVRARLIRLGHADSKLEDEIADHALTKAAVRQVGAELVSDVGWARGVLGMGKTVMALPWFASASTYAHYTHRVHTRSNISIQHTACELSLAPVSQNGPC